MRPATNQAKPVAQRLQTHCFGVDGNRTSTAKDIVGKILFMKKNGHWCCSILLVFDMSSAVPDCAFQGKFRGGGEVERLRGYREELFQFVYQRTADFCQIRHFICSMVQRTSLSPKIVPSSRTADSSSSIR